MSQINSGANAHKMIMLSFYFTNKIGSVFYLSLVVVVAVVQWMHSISHWAWLLTGWPCTPLCLNSLFYFMVHNRKQTMKNCAAPGLLLSHHHRPAISSAQQAGWIYAVTAGFTGSNKDLSTFGVRSMTDSAHYCTDKCHSSALNFSFNQSLFFFFGGLSGIQTYSILSIQAWRMTSWG